MKRLVVLLLLIARPSWATFTQAQAAVSAEVGVNHTTLNCVYGGAPAAGDLEICSYVWFTGGSTPPASFTVQDSNGNTFTETPNSPSTGNAASSGFSLIFYRLSAAANATATIQATFTTNGASGATGCICEDFSVSGGAVSFDQDAAGSGTGSSGTSPTVPVAGSSELLDSFSTQATKACTNAGTPWTFGKEETNTASCEAYILSASANTALNMTYSGSTAYNTIGASFKQASASTTTPQRALTGVGL